MIEINPQAADVITIQLSDADQIALNTTAILLEDRDVDTLQGEDGAYYLDRDNHTGTQAANTITGLATVATSGSYNDLSDKPTISTNAETLDGQDGAYYLSRANHTDEQAISTVTGLQDTLDLKLDAADYNDRFLGLFASVFDLEAAHPTASAGDYAQVDWGIGVDVIVCAWDVSDAYWAAIGVSAISTTDDVPEGSSNLYFTSQRVRDTPLTGLSTASATPVTAADSVLSAAGKLQAQISAASGGGAVGGFYAAGRFYTNCNAVVEFATAAVAALQQRTAFFEPLADMRVDQIGVFLTAAPSATALIKLAVYEFDAANPAQLNLLHEFAEITADTTTGAKMASANFTFLAGWLYVIVQHSNAAMNYRAFPPYVAPSAVLPTIGATMPASLWFANSVPYSATAAATLNTSAMSPQTANPTLILMRAA